MKLELKKGDVVYLRTRGNSWGLGLCKKSVVDKVTPSGQIVTDVARLDKRGREMGRGYDGWQICSANDYAEVQRETKERKARLALENAAAKLTSVRRLTADEITERVATLNAAAYEALALINGQAA